MRARTKIGLISAGYAGAILVAFAVVAISAALGNGPDRQASSGMSAFGDSLLFLAVFGVAAVVPTAAALYCLRPYRSFWLGLSIAALAIAGSGVAAVIEYGGAQAADAVSVAGSWSAAAVLRILVAPLLALGFVLSGLFAPNRSARIALFVATVVEAAVFARVALIWAQSYQAH